MRTVLLRISIGIAVGVGVLLLANGFAGARPPAASLSAPTTQPERRSPPGVPTPAPERGALTGDLLRTTERDRLRLCVQSLTPVVTDAVVGEAVLALMPQIRSHPDYRPSGLDVKPYSVENGCPGTPHIDRPDFKTGGNRDPKGPEASPYQAFVYVVSAERVIEDDLNIYAHERTLGFPGPRLIGREVRRAGPDSGVFVGTSSELYVTPKELADAAYLLRALQRAIGLEPLDEREVRLKRERDAQATVTAFATRPPKWRISAGREPVFLRTKPDGKIGDPLVELASGTLLIQWAPEVEDRGVRWLPVRVGSAEGQPGYVRAGDVVPVA